MSSLLIFEVILLNDLLDQLVHCLLVNTLEFFRLHELSSESFQLLNLFLLMLVFVCLKLWVNLSMLFNLLFLLVSQVQLRLLALFEILLVLFTHCEVIINQLLQDSLHLEESASRVMVSVMLLESE